jgi:hypothetical protein
MPATRPLVRRFTAILLALSALLSGCTDENRRDMWAMNFSATNGTSPAAPDGLSGVIVHRTGGKVAELPFHFPAQFNSGGVSFQADEFLALRINPTPLERPIRLAVVRAQDHSRHANVRIHDASAGFELSGPFTPVILHRSFPPAALSLAPKGSLNAKDLDEQIAKIDPSLRPSQNTGGIATASSHTKVDILQRKRVLDGVEIVYLVRSPENKSEVISLEASLTFARGRFDQDGPALVALTERYLAPMLALLLRDPEAIAWLREELLVEVPTINDPRRASFGDILVFAGRYDPVHPAGSEQVSLRLTR